MYGQPGCLPLIWTKSTVVQYYRIFPYLFILCLWFLRLSFFRPTYVYVFFCFILLAHWGGHIERSTGHSNPVMTLSAGGAKGYLDRLQVPCTPSLHCPIAQLLSMHQHRASIRRLIKSSQLRVRSDTQTTVSHPSTNQAQLFLTSVIVRELVFPS